MYQLQLIGLGCRVLCWEGFWGWKECQELLVMSVTSEEGEGGSSPTSANCGHHPRVPPTLDFCI